MISPATEMVIGITCIIHSVITLVGALALVKYLVFGKW